LVHVPEDRRYTQEHEWALLEDGKVRIGITAYAQEALGDVVFVSLPEVGRRVQTGESVAEVESTKSVAEVYAPLNGVVAAVNTDLAAHPELVNTDPYGEGWFIVFETEGPSTLDALLDAAAYRAQVG
jgi:glycine cleavage system H protein